VLPSPDKADAWVMTFAQPVAVPDPRHAGPRNIAAHKYDPFTYQWVGHVKVLRFREPQPTEQRLGCVWSSPPLNHHAGRGAHGNGNYRKARGAQRRAAERLERFTRLSRTSSSGKSRAQVWAGRLTMPVVTIGGEASYGEHVGDAVKLLADDVQSVVMSGAGPLGRRGGSPEDMLAARTAFLAPYRDAEHMVR
jgi:hypothetical protein